MQTEKHIVILPAPNCRRSKKIIAFLNEQSLSYDTIDLESQEGEKIMEEFSFKASPGILVDGKSINPYEMLDQKICRVDAEKALNIFK